jgi:hypothetical protein
MRDGVWTGTHRHGNRDERRPAPTMRADVPGGTAAVVATWLLGLSGGDVRAVTAYGVVLVVASFLAVLARPARPTPFPESGEEAQR